LSNLIKYAERELALLGGADDEMQKAMNAHVLKMVALFADEGHSGFSAAYSIGILERLLRFEPLTPLTGADSEWCEVSENVFQNRRCGHVFKGPDGAAYDIDGRIFREPSGACYTNHQSRVPVTFPYTPKREYVDVEAVS
jgi:hypothetical protein